MTLLLAPRPLGRSIGNDAFMKPFRGSLGQRWQNHHLPLEMLLLPQKLPRCLHTHGRLSGHYNSPEAGLSLGPWDSQPRGSHAQRATSGSQRCGTWPHPRHRGGTQAPHLTGRGPVHPKWRIWPPCLTQPCQSLRLRPPGPTAPGAPRPAQPCRGPSDVRTGSGTGGQGGFSENPAQRNPDWTEWPLRALGSPLLSAAAADLIGSRPLRWCGNMAAMALGTDPDC